VRLRTKSEQRGIRHRRLRGRLAGTPERPRLVVYRSLNHIYAQIVDDVAGRTLAAAGTQSKELKGKIKHGGNKEAAALVGELIAKQAAERGIKRVCLDRAGFKYHGCVAKVAESARAAGLEF